MCGICGAIGKKDIFFEIYKGLKMIQHRGQDTCGMSTFEDKFHIKKYEGLVGNSFSIDDVKELKGFAGIAHVRYPTTGKGGVENAQPIFTNTPYGIIMAHNGNVVNYYELKNILQNQYKRYINTDVDVEIILNVFAHYFQKNGNLFENICYAVNKVFEIVHGSYSVIAYIAGIGFIAFRDPLGFKPLIYGHKKDLYGFASESVSLDAMGITEYIDIKPGEIVFIDNKLNVKTKVLSEKKQKACIFEWVYFARPDSIIDNISVYKARYRLGEQLAEQLINIKHKFDVVMPVPDTSRTAALACANKLNLPYREGLIKNRYVGRTFIMPGNINRMDIVKEKLNPIIAEIKDKRILLIDDSIVRGNTSKSIVKIVKQAGAKEVHFAVYSPPLKHPCYFGIDMQRKKEFIANKLELEDIKKEINADSLIYLDIKRLIKGVGINQNIFCDACFTGKYPISIDEKHIQYIQKDRDLSVS